MRFFSLELAMKEFQKNHEQLDGQYADVDAYYQATVALSRLGSQSEQLDEAIAKLREAHRRFEQLHATFPQDAHYLDWVAESETLLADRLRALGEMEESEMLRARAVARRGSGCLGTWNSPVALCLTYELGKQLSRQAIVMWNAAQISRAFELFSGCLSCFQRLVEFSSDNPRYLRWKAACEAGIARCRSEMETRESREWSKRDNRKRKASRDIHWREHEAEFQLGNDLNAKFHALQTTPAARSNKSRQNSRFREVFHDISSPGYAPNHLPRGDDVPLCA